MREGKTDLVFPSRILQFIPAASNIHVKPQFILEFVQHWMLFG